MRFIKRNLVAFGRWYDRHIRVEPGVLVWPASNHPRPVRVRARRNDKS